MIKILFRNINRKWLLNEEKNILNHVNEVKESFIERVKDLEKYSFVGDARAVGLIGAIEFVTEPHTNKKPDPIRKVAAKIQQKIQESGVILRSLPGDSLAFCPPLIIEESQIHEMFDKIDSVLAGINFQTLWYSWNMYLKMLKSD